MSESILVEDYDTFKLNNDMVKETVDEIKSNIPSNFIEIRLPSNGAFEDIPRVLHFRNYCASESLDISMASDEDKPRIIADVLKGMCFEKFEISELPIQDILYILYYIQAKFINPIITKTILLDENEDYSEENSEEVEIPIHKLNCILFGKDSEDKDYEQQIKVPFSIKDTKDNHVIKFRFPTLKDSIIAQRYCKKHFADEFLKYNTIRKRINDIQEISNLTKRTEAESKFLEEHFSECEEFYEFQKRYNLEIAKIMQCLQIVGYDGNDFETLEEKWNCYTTQIPTSIWVKFNDISEKYQFGLDNNVEVYSNKLKKKLVRNVGFQLSDFLSVDEQKDDERYVVLS